MSRPQPPLGDPEEGTAPALPTPVRMAGALVALQGLGVVVLGAGVAVSGFANRAAVGQLLGQVAYFVVLGLAMIGLGGALWLGKRWARTPVLVTQIVLVAVGYWMAVPSSRPVWGIALILAGVVTGGLLLLPVSGAWTRAVPVLAPTPAAPPDPRRELSRRTPPKSGKGRRPAGRRRR